MSDYAGQQLGQYILAESIGKGGMATVYRATQESIGREVAVKILNRSLLEQDQTFLERFYREVQVIAHLQHPHILPVYDYGEHDGLPYIVMAYLGGGTLADYINQQELLKLGEAVRITRQVAGALDYAHQQGIIHRDIKPSNILLDLPGNAYLADFGLARMVGQSEITGSAGVIGTPDYMAPDWAEADNITSSVDVYALGVTLYQMLVGEVPYQASTSMGVLMAHLNNPIPDARLKRPDLPDAVQDVLAKAMAKDVESRYPAAGELLTDLEHALDPVRDIITDSQKTGTEGQYFLPNAWVYHLRRALLEVLTQSEYETLKLMGDLGWYLDHPVPDNMNKDYPFEHSGPFWRAVYQVYGSRGHKVISTRVGELFWKIGFQEDSLAKMVKSAVKLLPAEKAVTMGLRMYSDHTNRVSDMLGEFEEHDDHWTWRLLRCSDCWGWTAGEPVCYTTAGILRAAVAWLTGKPFRVIETECIAMGDDACVFVINKKPLTN